MEVRHDPSDGERLLAAFERIESLVRRDGEVVRWERMNLVVLAWFHDVEVELETVEGNGVRNLHIAGEVLVYDPCRAVGPWRLFTAEVWAASADLRDELDESGPGPARSCLAGMQLHPSIDIDVDIDGEALANLDDEQRRFERFLRTIPGQALGRPPCVAVLEDDDAVYLRGTVWLSAYSEDLALAAEQYVLGWAASHELDCQVHF